MLLKNFNVLVVDDVILMSEFLYGVVSRIPGNKTFKCLDGRTASEILENEPIDLLITDIEIKGPNGVALAYKVRSGAFAATAHDIPIIIFSGNTYLELIKKCISLDVNDFIAKPVNSETLTKKVLHHLQVEKEIRDAEYYRELANGNFLESKAAIEQRKSNVFIVHDPATSDEEQPIDDEELNRHKSEKKDFLHWPDSATTGLFPLDRRLRNLAYKVSCFHNVFVAQCKTVAIEQERKKAYDAMDYLFHIVRNFKDKDLPQELLLALNVRIEKLRPLADELSKVNVRNHGQVLSLLKKLSFWWMQTCNRPLIQRTEEQEEELTQ